MTPLNPQQATLSALLTLHSAHGDTLFTHSHLRAKLAAALCPPLDADVAAENWLPTSENINALPLKVSEYIHSLETNADPSGTHAQLIIANDLIEQLTFKIVKEKLANGR